MEDEKDLLVLDSSVKALEAVSGAILNRNRKSLILGLGAWAGRQEWPVVWLQPCTEVTVYGVTVAPSYKDTLRLSWEHTVSGTSPGFLCTVKNYSTVYTKANHVLYLSYMLVYLCKIYIQSKFESTGKNSFFYFNVGYRNEL
jgi:hypothetical protein